MFMNLVKTLGHVHCTIYNARTTTVPYAFIVVLTIVRYNYPLHFTGYVHIYIHMYIHVYIIHEPLVCTSNTMLAAHKN